MLAGQTLAVSPYSPKCVEGEFCELRLLGILGSCASPCNASYLTTLRNTAGLISPPSLKEVALMMRRTLLLGATLALSLFAANCVLLLAQELTHPQRAQAADPANRGFSQDCQQSAVGNFDPIVFPNTPPDVGHRHVFFGSTAIKYNATLADLQAGTSNCKFRSTFPNTNKSAYWVPDLLLRTGKWAGIGKA